MGVEKVGKLSLKTVRIEVHPSLPQLLAGFFAAFRPCDMAVRLSVTYGTYEDGSAEDLL